KAFEGTSQASLIGAIMQADPPPISHLQPLTPSALERVVRICLAKDPDDRWQTARDLVRELRWIAQSDSQVAVTATSVKTSRSLLGNVRVAWAVAALFFTIALLGTLTFYLRSTENAQTIRFLVLPPDGWNLTLRAIET